MSKGHVLVTGAGSPVGRAVAVEALRRGYEPLLTSRTQSHLDATVARVQTESGPIPARLANLSLGEESESLLTWATSLAGELTAIVHCAFGHCGEDEGVPIAKVDDSTMRDFLDDSIISLWNLVRSMARAKKGTRLVVFGADWGFPQHNVLTYGQLDGEPPGTTIGSEIYVSAKYAASGMVAALERQSGVQSVGIYPGPIMIENDEGATLDIDDEVTGGEGIRLRDVAATAMFAVELKAVPKSIVLKPPSPTYDGINA